MMFWDLGEFTVNVFLKKCQIEIYLFQSNQCNATLEPSWLDPAHDEGLVVPLLVCPVVPLVQLGRHEGPSLAQAGSDLQAKSDKELAPGQGQPSPRLHEGGTRCSSPHGWRGPRS